MRWIFLSWALALVACSEGATDATTESRREAVIGGKTSPDADDGVLAVRIDRPGGTSVCSGSLIAPNLVLTARHCITAMYVEDNIRCTADGTLEMPSGGQLGDPVDPESVTVYLGARPSTDGNSGLPGGEPSGVGAQIVTSTWPNVCRDDVALVVLDREVSAPIVPLDLTTQVTKATRISSIGYGLTESSMPGELWSPRKRRDNVAVKYIDSLPNTFGVGRAVCQGDSGGPAIDSLTGGIVGVYSLGFPGVDLNACSSDNALNYYARLGAYETLLREGFEAATQPFPEPSNGEGGAGNEGGAASAGAGNEVVEGGAAGAADEEPPIKKPTSTDDSGCSTTGAPANGPSLLLFAAVALGAMVRRRR